MLKLEGMVSCPAQVSGLTQAEVYLNGECVGGYGRMADESDWDFGDEINLIAAFAVREI